MKHIAYITSEYPHKNTPPAGGIGSFIKMMATYLVAQGYQVTIFLCLSSNEKIWFDEKIRIVEIKSVNPSKLSVIKDRFRIRKQIKKYIKEDNIDLIEAADWEGLHAFCNFKIPLITRIHGSVTYFNHLQNLPRPKLLSLIEKKAIKQSDKIIAVSEFSGKLTQEVMNLSSLNFEVIYNGINTETFSNLSNKSTKNTIILYFGTLARKKGSIALSHIFNILHVKNPKAKLILVGKNALDKIENKSTWNIMQSILTTSALKQVDYKGTIPYKEISTIIAETTICVFPSFAEAFPISWLEAMAMQKPIVASSIGWARESIIDKESGLLENPNNYKSFAYKIDFLLKDKKLALRLGENARERILRLFDQKKIIKQNIQVYKKVLKDE